MVLLVIYDIGLLLNGLFYFAFLMVKNIFSTVLHL